MTLLKVIVLAIVQGLAELLPVSSSAHVVVAEKLMGLDPSSPPMTLLLVMLHTGTMFAVIVYFWKQWRETFFSSPEAFKRFAWLTTIATAITLVLGEIVVKVIEKTAFRDVPHAEIESLFSHLELIAPALAAAGVLVIVAGILQNRRPGTSILGTDDVTPKQAGIIGTVQGLCLPFRGFSRSGATISTGILMGVSRTTSETFSFALAVVLTPFVVVVEAMRLIKAEHLSGAHDLGAAALPSLIGMVCSFFAGLLALKWLSKWLEGGRWYLFGIYCVIAAAGVLMLHFMGY
ncbi:MAG TPA: undecaprenyl-diphosphate phosphatase [Acidisarcina sp.]